MAFSTGKRALKRAAQTACVKLLSIHELSSFFQNSLHTVLKGISLRSLVQHFFKITPVLLEGLKIHEVYYPEPISNLVTISSLLIYPLF